MPTGKKITDPSVPQTGTGIQDFLGLLTLGVNNANESVRIPIGAILLRAIQRAGVIYRIDTEHPLQSGYYTLSTAIAAIVDDGNVSDEERSGMLLIFFDGSVFRMWQFQKLYNNADGVDPKTKFLNSSNWMELAVDVSQKADKSEIYTKTQVDEKLRVFYTKEQIDEAFGNYYTKQQVNNALNNKLDANQGAGNAGKVMTVGADGNLTPATPASAVVDNLTSTDATLPLAANQGRVLSGRVAALEELGIKVVEGHISQEF